jgi:hypothetical protein
MGKLSKLKKSINRINFLLLSLLFIMDSTDQFYVSLLSSNSLNIFHHNVLSAFTNLLKTPLRLDDSWCVGVSEIAFNDYKKGLNDLHHQRGR